MNSAAKAWLARLTQRWAAAAASSWLPWAVPPTLTLIPAAAATLATRWAPVIPPHL